ncbi:MAG: TPM domain-containing protein [Ferruginibacter sp.]
MNRILAILIFVLFSISTTYGQKHSQVTLDSTSKLNNSKHKSPPAPLNPIGYTSDYEHILSATEIDTLNSIIKYFEKETTIQIAIVSIDSSYTTKDDFDDFITGLGRSWGVGQKDKNNGIIIGISTGLRKIRISNGDGIEKKLSDDETKKIIDERMLPEFKQEHYFEGLRKGMAAIMVKLKQ